MPTEHILALLVAERDKLNRAIEALQGARRRGRPPKGLTAVAPESSDGVPAARKARSAAQRKAQSKRMKEYWAKRRRESKS